jgi:hypothetical protein
MARTKFWLLYIHVPEDVNAEESFFFPCLRPRTRIAFAFLLRCMYLYHFSSRNGTSSVLRTLAVMQVRHELIILTVRVQVLVLE